MPAIACYTSPKPAPSRTGQQLQNTVAGLANPLEFAATSRNRTDCGFFVGAPVKAALMGERKLCRFSLREFPGLQPVSAAANSCKVGWQSFLGTHWSTNMGKLPRRIFRVTIINGQPTTTSRAVAETFGKRHRDVIERIKQLDCSEEFRSANFSAHPYIDEQNKQEYTEYRITRDGVMFLIMGFTGKPAAQSKEGWIAEFNRRGELLAEKQQKQALSHTQHARSAHKSGAHQAAPMLALPDHSTAAIGQGLPPLPEGLVIPPEIAAQIEAAAIPLAMRCLPALRSYLERRVAESARNASGWIPDRVAPTLASASLATALQHQAHQELQSCIQIATALNTITAQALATMQQAKGQA